MTYMRLGEDNVLKKKKRSRRVCEVVAAVVLDNVRVSSPRRRESILFWILTPESNNADEAGCHPECAKEGQEGKAPKKSEQLNFDGGCCCCCLREHGTAANAR